MTVGAGEPMVFAYRPRSSAGVPESLAGRAFLHLIYDKTGMLKTSPATIVEGANVVAIWRLDGSVSESLRTKTGLKHEICEILDNGRDIIATGNLIVSDTAPMITDYDSAPIAKYVIMLTRDNDASTIEAPNFSIDILPFTPIMSAVLPTYSSAPTVSGSSTVGGTLTGSDGVANAPITARQWLLNSTAITGATNLTYVTSAAGAYTYRTTATNSNGNFSATSAAFNVTAAVINAPANTTAPAISGTGTTGQTLTSTTGTWTNSPTSYAYQWLRAGVAISGAMAAAYVLVAADEGKAITCRLTATNAGGSASATSNAITAAAVVAPTVSISASQTQMEGNTGTTAYAFTLSLNRNGSTATYPYSWTVAGSGTNPADATDFGGTLPSGSGTFAAGETSKTITVLVTGDTNVESDETFTLTVATTGLNTVSIANTITNDDTATATSIQAITSRNHFGNEGNATTASTNMDVCRMPATIGNAAVSSVGMVFSSYYGQNVKGSSHYLQAHVEYNGVTVVCTFGGANFRNMISGDVAIETDQIPASAFGVSQIPANAKIFTLVERTWTAGDNRITNGVPKIESGFGCYRGPTGSTSKIGTVGAITNAGGWIDYSARFFGPVVVTGRPVTFMPAVITVGASIESGTADDENRGYCVRAAQISPQYAHGLFSRGGETSTGYLSTDGDSRRAFYKYFNRAINGYGGNDFSGGTPKETSAANMATINAQLKAAGIQKIAQIRMSPKSDSTDSYVTVANQTVRTINGGFNVYRNYIDAQAALDPNMTRLVDMTSVQEPANEPGKWVVNGTASYATADGTHPTAPIHALMTTPLRAAVDIINQV